MAQVGGARRGGAGAAVPGRDGGGGRGGGGAAYGVRSNRYPFKSRSGGSRDPARGGEPVSGGAGSGRVYPRPESSGKAWVTVGGRSEERYVGSGG